MKHVRKSVGGRERSVSRTVFGLVGGVSLIAASLTASGAIAQTTAQASAADPSQLPANWRDIKEGVGGYPAGPMLEIALRRTHSDKLEMFKWRSESIALLAAQPGPLVEREWHSLVGFPANTGAGTWTGMTWWENQQKWHDMANVLFPTQVFKHWLQTIDMTLVFVKPVDRNFDLRTLAQSGAEVLELGLLVFPASGAASDGADDPAPAQAYLNALKSNGAETYRFAIYKNPMGFVGPYTAAYNKNGPPATTGERWFVYMATYKSQEARNAAQSTPEVHQAFEALGASMVKAHSDIQVMSRTTSQICIKNKTHTYSLDPDECHVGEMGSGDTWAGSYGERPQPCVTSYDVYSELPPKTCEAVGGRRVDPRPVGARR